MTIVLISHLFISATEKFDQSSWLQWKTDTFKSHLESKTSFLNATSLEFATKGKSLYLSSTLEPLSTKWKKSRYPGFHIKVQNKGNQALLTRPGKKDVVLSDGNRRFQWPLKNGLIAEAVYSKSNKKVWGYIYDPQQIKKFTGFRFYPFNKNSVIEATFKKTKKKIVSYKTVQGDLRKVSKIGQVFFKLNGKEITLDGYNWQKEGEAPNYFALIFTDSTAGKETYAGGREVVIKFSDNFSQEEKVVIDFNRTTNFFCAHSPFWHCPTGLQQKVTTSLKSGEMLPLKKIAKR